MTQRLDDGATPLMLRFVGPVEALGGTIPRQRRAPDGDLPLIAFCHFLYLEISFFLFRFKIGVIIFRENVLKQPIISTKIHKRH